MYAVACLLTGSQCNWFSMQCLIRSMYEKEQQRNDVGFLKAGFKSAWNHLPILLNQDLLNLCRDALYLFCRRRASKLNTETGLKFMVGRCHDFSDSKILLFFNCVLSILGEYSGFRACMIVFQQTLLAFKAHWRKPDVFDRDKWWMP